jgi:DNA-binding MarR family transcriptional regulator
MASRLPLPTLLSHALVAFTIELDDEFEQRLPHRTSRGPAAGARGPWLVSLAMWSNFMRFVDADGVSVAELRARTGMPRETLASTLARMGKWWGYVTVSRAAVARPTAAGLRAQALWCDLLPEIEARWRERFGEQRIGALRESLAPVADDLALPRYLPVGGATLEPRPEAADEPLELPALLSRALLAFALDVEREVKIPLAIGANTLRVLDETGVRVRDLPRLTGVAKEAVSVQVGFLERHACATVEPDPAAARGKVVRLTAKGRRAQDKTRRTVSAVEERWRARFGAEAIDALRAALSPPFCAPEPHPDGWRASLPRPATLPHHPVVSHRGGYPDGS